MPPIKLVRGGELQQDVLEMHTRKSRTPDHLALQLRSQMAGINTVQARMAEVLGEYGPRVVKGAMRRMIRDASRAIGERLLRIPDGEWEERIYMAGLGRRGPLGAPVRHAACASAATGWSSATRAPIRSSARPAASTARGARRRSSR